MDILIIIIIIDLLLFFALSFLCMDKDVMTYFAELDDPDWAKKRKDLLTSLISGTGKWGK